MASMNIFPIQHSPLKWVGGKLSLLKSILLPAFDKNLHYLHDSVEYHELFLGSGVVALNLLKRYPQIKKFHLSDINSDLIGFWKCVQLSLEELKSHLTELIQYTDSNVDKATAYYAIRELFNREKSNPESLESPEHAAKFLYLNRMGFRGVYRKNKSGEYNVPYGNYKWPVDFGFETLDEVHILIADSTKVEFIAEPFDSAFERINPDIETLAYFDPPYYPVKQTAFVGYTSSGFHPEDHIRLFTEIKNQRNIQTVPSVFLLSNADVAPVRDVFEAREWTIESFDCRRACNSINPGATQAEILITGRM